MNTVAKGHTYKRFDTELMKLEDRVVAMGTLVKEQLQKVQIAIQHEDEEKAIEVVKGDRPINMLELKADKMIIKLIAQRAPVGGDLRFIVAVSRMVNELEDLGDETIDMAKTLLPHSSEAKCSLGAPAIQEISALMALIIEFFDKALLAFQQHDRVAATEVAFGHAGPDGELQARLKHLNESALSQGSKVDEVINLVLAIRSLERMRDFIRNMGEHVIYLVTGEDVRHQD